MERNSLEYLLFHFCGVTANKEWVSYASLSFIILSLILVNYSAASALKLTSYSPHAIRLTISSLQIPECRLEVTPSTRGDVEVRSQVLLMLGLIMQVNMRLKDSLLVMILNQCLIHAFLMLG